MSGYGTPEVVATGLRFPEGPVVMPDGSVLSIHSAHEQRRDRSSASTWRATR